MPMASTTTTTQLGENITLEQLAEHDTLKSLWIAVHGRGRRIPDARYGPQVVKLTSFSVYDLTNFSTDHPGGVEALEISAGTDGTEAYEYAGHSEENMAKMEQYSVGKVAGCPEPAPPIPHDPLSGQSKRMRSAAVGLKQKISPQAKLAVTVVATSMVVVLTWRLLSPTLDVSKPQFTSFSGPRSGLAFWAGVAIPSLVNVVVLRYLYGLFLSSLDYQNDVFSFPPTIPRKTRR